jgi:hemolysin III
MVGFSIFSFSVFFLYLASSLYHLLTIDDNGIKILRKLDHVMIFVLIAGSYTPICLISLNGFAGFLLLGFVWIFAILGAVLKLFWINAKRFVSTAIYVILGWLAIFVFFPLIKAMSANTFIFLLLGGITYTMGAVVYALKWPRFSSKLFGFHEIFHIFVIVGTTFHIICMYTLL